MPLRITRNSLSLSAGLATALAVSAAAYAQEPVRAEPDSPGPTPAVELRTAPLAESTLADRYYAVRDGRLGVRPAEPVGTGPVPVARYRGSYAGTGAIVGGSLGVAFGVFTGIIVAATCETDDCNGIRPYLIAIPLFGSAGALVGAGVGALFPKGH